MAWQNKIYSTTNQDIELKFLRDMNWFMAHIFVSKLFWEMPLYGYNFKFLKIS